MPGNMPVLYILLGGGGIDMAFVLMQTLMKSKAY